MGKAVGRRHTTGDGTGDGVFRVKIKHHSPLRKKARRGFRGYPVATVAFYGPDDRHATKVAVGIVTAEGIEGPDRRRVLMSVITMLGRHDQDAESEFVFDKIDRKLVLSEVWMPGKDGLLLLATKGPHEHAVLGGPNPKK